MEPLTPLSSSWQLGTGFSDEELEEHHQSLQVRPPCLCVPGALALRGARVRAAAAGPAFQPSTSTFTPQPCRLRAGASTPGASAALETGSGRVCCPFPEFALRMPVEPLVVGVFAVLVPGIWGVLWLSCVLVSLVLSVPFLVLPLSLSRSLTPRLWVSVPLPDSLCL